MQQLIFAILVTVLVVSLGVANSHHVELFLVVGEPVRIRLVFLLAIAAAAGAVGIMIRQMVQRVVSRSRFRRQEMMAQARLQADGEEDLL